MTRKEPILPFQIDVELRGSHPAYLQHIPYQMPRPKTAHVHEYFKPAPRLPEGKTNRVECLYCGKTTSDNFHRKQNHLKVCSESIKTNPRLPQTARELECSPHPSHARATSRLSASSYPPPNPRIPADGSRSSSEPLPRRRTRDRSSIR